ncbi:hypothetical protein [Flavobacterium phragmitis]|uniref:Uncharacterized protein n=1 Tax=Flavobacterium phragmitis TaxID=739143 RepID=A0A1I1TDJ7_9FLAO|nr:hypothetical protein [Flavobacterium phragmitis]SFD54383.1 hypothetical protein SAMN05216297_10934 [Flavobacterium phragmitis]
MKTIKKGMLALVAVLGFGLSAQAQNTTTDVTKQAAVAAPGATVSLGGSVRVIDNKGTVKYLQVQNGLTQITNTNAAGNIVTTWQLGGALTDHTYIDAAGKIFALDGIKLVTNDMTPGTSVNIGEGSSHTGTTTGADPYAFLVRNEVTGETMKLLPSQLVKTGSAMVAVTTAGTSVDSLDSTSNLGFLPSDVTKVSVYRNGAKLLAGTDYTLTAGKLTVNGTGGADPEDYSLMTSDKIEVQWIN